MIVPHGHPPCSARWVPGFRSSRVSGTAAKRELYRRGPRPGTRHARRDGRPVAHRSKGRAARDARGEPLRAGADTDCDKKDDFVFQFRRPPPFTANGGDEQASERKDTEKKDLVSRISPHLNAKSLLTGIRASRPALVRPARPRRSIAHRMGAGIFTGSPPRVIRSGTGTGR
jgi:hypothetical protein